MMTNGANGTAPYLASDDASFDAIYPAEIRRVSRQYWTPIGVARRAAELLRDAGARHVLDVGSGVGKFVLVAAATAPDVQWIGIEQRAHLADHAREAKRILSITNASFIVGDATDASWGEYDAFYFYNSFAENLFDAADYLDDRAELSMHRYAIHAQRTAVALRAAPVGTVLATYHGSSVRIPTSYELAHAESAGTGWLRLWRKGCQTDDGSFFSEVRDSVVRHDANGQFRESTKHLGRM